MALAGVALSTACGDGGTPGSPGVASPTAGTASPGLSPGPPGSGRPTGPAGPLPTGHTSPPRGAPTVHDLGADDSGKTVTLAVGDRLLVTLSGDKLTARWTLTAYPRGALTADLASTPGGRFGFVARAAGSGRIVLTRSGCGPAGDPCPSGGALPRAALTWTAVIVVR